MKIRAASLLQVLVLSAMAAAAQAQQAVILVRHAELAGAAMAAPKGLPLSPAGEERALRLASLLKDSGVGAIYVTDFARTADTAAPTARLLGVEPVALPKGDPGELVQRLRASHAGKNVLLVGHTDTLPGLLKSLGHPADIKIAPDDYGSIYVVTPRPEGAPTVLRLRY